MGKQLDMFDGEATAPHRPMVAELAAAHRARGSKREAPRRRRDGLRELFCPSCGSRIALDLAQALAT